MKNRINSTPAVDVSNVARAEFVSKLSTVDIPRLLAHGYAGGADVLETALAHLGELERQRDELASLIRRAQVTGQQVDGETAGRVLADVSGEHFTAV